MKRLWTSSMLLASALLLASCASSPTSGWVTLIDGEKGMENFDRLGDGKGGGKWNTFKTSAQGATITVDFNGVRTVTLQDSKFASGPFTLQFANGPKDAPGGPIKWRKVMVKAL